MDNTVEIESDIDIDAMADEETFNQEYIPTFEVKDEEEEIIELITNQIKTLEEDSYDFKFLSEGLFLFP